MSDHEDLAHHILNLEAELAALKTKLRRIKNPEPMNKA